MTADYDQQPYDAQPFSDARPAALGALGHLHGLSPASIASARVLELGCASGGHLVPLAWRYPAARFVGIDLSAAQIDAGRRLVEALGLSNCELHAGDATCFAADAVGYDYIIAHGLLSWIAPGLRAPLLRSIRAALAPGGLAYVSYNVLPGWRERGILRELLQQQLKDTGTAPGRVAAARELMQQLVAGIDDANHPLAADMLRVLDQPDSYIAHEYLEPDNHPLYLREFVAEAEAAGLRYLCDADLGRELAGNYGAQVEPVLAARSRDPIERLQLLDFLANRVFRQSLLCRDDAPATGLDMESLRLCHLLSDLQPPKHCDLRSTKAQDFVNAGGQRCPVRHPLAKAALRILSRRFPASVGWDELIEQAGEEVSKAGARALAAQESVLLQTLFDLYSTQWIEALVEPQGIAVGDPARPAATPLARAQAHLGWDHTATVQNRVFGFDPFLRQLILHLDGERERDRLVADLSTCFAPGGPLHELSGADQPPAKLHRLIDAQLDRLLPILTRHGLLDRIG